MRMSELVSQLAAPVPVASAEAAVEALVAGGGPSALFQPLVADPNEPQFFATYLWARSPRLASRLGSVGFGQTIGLVGGPDWQVAITAGVVSQINMGSSNTDLLNTD